ncbi:response regulator transcription factor [Streptomyces sp. NPDC053079]|uniref:response regulator transcription factor n=1 Tax=Streptomyces sp. NPDC053079 TaxID=3365697 RepID=UPI0037D12524
MTSRLPSPDDRYLLRLLANGRSNPEIAEAMGRAENTVKSRMAKLRRQLGARNRWHLVAQAFRCRLISPDDVRIPEQRAVRTEAGDE